MKSFNASEKYVSIVPVRKGSKGLKNKNLRELNGVPLYLIAVNQALRLTNKCILSTDIEEIFNNKPPRNCYIHKRRKELCQDSTRMNQVINNIINEMHLINSDVLLLQATSPLRKDSDIQNCMKLFSKKKYSMLLSVNKANSDILKHGTVDKSGFFRGLRDTKDCFANRQDLPTLFKPNGSIYIFNTKEFIKSNDFPINSIGIYEMPRERSIDIDNESDFEKVSTFMNI
ncbi:Hypothetical protein NATL1_08741 [Prochlorococcus marinus str. NATL1A]|uniref:N-acylneuraminate cytidylyltransferase n=1 Tax=Prochlorococcus marinus (strain NATL1A) TaxID=167555 RepID=A2C1S2_PROM1|nr:acylneuraminate cytidylyltransferase family protein [Prochlorococcus marinus]ABM75432.1 Hypothetical protein NATL1_08741 [Prochlorococcus marinus str. NATL1A]